MRDCPLFQKQHHLCSSFVCPGSSSRSLPQPRYTLLRIATKMQTGNFPICDYSTVTHGFLITAFLAFNKRPSGRCKDKIKMELKNRILGNGLDSNIVRQLPGANCCKPSFPHGLMCVFWSVGYWGRVFESRSKHGYFSSSSVLCCLVTAVVTIQNDSRSEQNRTTLQHELRIPGEKRQLITCEGVAKLATLYW
jgi:hypothetical protein